MTEDEAIAQAQAMPCLRSYQNSICIYDSCKSRCASVMSRAIRRSNRCVAVHFTSVCSPAASPGENGVYIRDLHRLRSQTDDPHNGRSVQPTHTTGRTAPLLGDSARVLGSRGVAAKESLGFPHELPTGIGYYGVLHHQLSEAYNPNDE
jgi:hypothetical protein